jgi:glycine/D-amino acid oxidase-like deaminating enzyme
MTGDPSADPDPIPAYYAAQSPAPPPSAPLVGDLAADVVIVGAGYSGLSAALHLSERGARVIVLEAKEIGSGASSRNFGQVVPYLMPGPAEIRAAFPPDVAERMIARVGCGPDTVFSIIERYGIDCQPRRNGLLFAAHSSQGRTLLEARTAFWRDRGADVRMHDAAETAALVGSRHYRACSVDHRGGTINPVGYVRGLADAATRLGVRIFTGAAATAIDRSGPGWRVRTGAGGVAAAQVVLATNAYTSESLWPGLRHSIIPVRGYALVSAPIGNVLRAGILPGGQPLTDTRRTHSGVRLNADGCIHASTLGPPFDIDGAPDVARLDARIAAVFPQLGALRWMHRWSGWIALSQDRHPHLHELAPGVWAGLGYTGRGIAAATLMGQDIASRISGAPDAETTFPARPLRRWWMARFARPVVAAGIAHHRIRDALDEAKANRERAAS